LGNGSQAGASHVLSNVTHETHLAHEELDKCILYVGFAPGNGIKHTPKTKYHAQSLLNMQDFFAIAFKT
jgi:hypothetical protein